MRVRAKEPDLCILMVEIAWKNYEAGKIDRPALVHAMKLAINLRATENGYDQVYGVPFPELQERK